MVHCWSHADCEAGAYGPVSTSSHAASTAEQQEEVKEFPQEFSKKDVTVAGASRWNPYTSLPQRVGRDSRVGKPDCLPPFPALLRTLWSAIKHCGHRPVLPGPAPPTWAPRVFQTHTIPFLGHCWPCPLIHLQVNYIWGLLISWGLPAASWSASNFPTSRGKILPLSCKRPAWLAAFSADVCRMKKHFSDRWMNRVVSLRSLR